MQKTNQQEAEPLQEVHKQQSHTDHTAGGFLQACRNAVQTIGGLTGAEYALYLVAVAAVLIFLFLRLA